MSINLNIYQCRSAYVKIIDVFKQLHKEYEYCVIFLTKKNIYINNLKIIKSNQFPAEFNETDFTLLKIPEGNALKELEIVKELLKCDVLINIPIAKHHPSTFLTCGLKNMMGLNTRKSNVYCHTESGQNATYSFII